MKRGISLVALDSAALALLGCHREPKPVPVANLTFPVILITGTKPNTEVSHQARVMANADQLGHMRVELCSALSDTERNDPPIVIDSKAALFDMKEITGSHSGLRMLTNPTGMMPIQFKLIPREETRLSAARDLFLACRFFDYIMDSDQLTERREHVRLADTIQEIAVAAADPPEPVPLR